MCRKLDEVSCRCVSNLSSSGRVQWLHGEEYTVYYRIDLRNWLKIGLTYCFAPPVDTYYVESKFQYTYPHKCQAYCITDVLFFSYLAMQIRLDELKLVCYGINLNLLKVKLNWYGQFNFDWNSCMQILRWQLGICLFWYNCVEISWCYAMVDP